MDFEKPQDYADALKRLEGFPSTGVEIEDGRSVFHSLSSRVALPMGGRKGYGYGIVDYGLNELDVLVDHVDYNARFKQVSLFDEKSDVIAQVELKNPHSSMNVDRYGEYAPLAKGAVFTAEADGSTGAFVDRPATETGSAVELLFKDEDGDD